MSEHHVLSWHVPNAACEMALIGSLFADALFIVHNLDQKPLNIVSKESWLRSAQNFLTL